MRLCVVDYVVDDDDVVDDDGDVVNFLLKTLLKLFLIFSQELVELSFGYDGLPVVIPFATEPVKYFLQYMSPEDHPKLKWGINIPNHGILFSKSILPVKNKNTITTIPNINIPINI